MSEAVIADESELDPVIEKILAANEVQVEQYRSGKEGLLGFFVGQVMKETKILDGAGDAQDTPFSFLAM